MAAPLETWLAQHVADIEQLRAAPSFRNRHDCDAMWARLIDESDVIEYVPALVPRPGGDPLGWWRATQLAHPE